jgi:anti-sigma regulatory factor (Ser/Thr protein kinase)
MCPAGCAERRYPLERADVDDTDEALLVLRLPSRAEAPAAARTALGSLNSDLHLISEERLKDAQLLLTELVTNAVLHGEGDVSMWVTASSETLRVEVRDAGPRFELEALRGPSTEHAGGWGLRIVELLAHRWGVEGRGDQVRVWFEVDRPAAETPLPVEGEAPPPDLG